MNIKKTLLVASATIMSFAAFSQFSMSASGSYVNFFGDFSQVKAPGLGLQAEFGTDKGIITGGFNYFIPNTYEWEVDAYASESTVTPHSISLTAEEKVSTLLIHVGVKKYFAGDYDDDFGFYGTVDAGLMLLPYSTTINEDYDKSTYFTSIDGYTETLSNLVISGGLGFEYNIDPLYIFGETKLMIPANQVNGGAVEVEISPSAVFNVGVRYPFD